MKFLALTFAGFAAISTAVSAQTPEKAPWPPMLGIKARVLSPMFGDQKKVGVIEAARGDTLQFRAGKDVTHLAPSEIAKLDVLTGTHTATGKWTGIGFIAGTLAGAAIGVLTYKKKKSSPCGIYEFCYTPGNERSVAGANGALLGMILGSVVGAVYGHQPKETWTEFPVPTR